MKNKKVIIIVGITITVLAIVGLVLFMGDSNKNVVSDAQLKQDLQEIIERDFDYELTVDEINVEKRETSEQERETISVEVIASNELWAQKSYYILIYLYNEDGIWILDNYERNKTDEWSYTPKTGVSDGIIAKQVEEETADGSKVTLQDKTTDLANGTDTLTYSLEYDDGILAIAGTFDLVFKFNETTKEWEFDAKENENLQRIWTISGTWEHTSRNQTTRLEITEENGKVTGTIKITTTTTVSSNYTINFTTGTFDNGRVEMHGKVTTTSHSQNMGRDTNFTGTINSKDGTMQFTMSNFFALPTLTKK